MYFKLISLSTYFICCIQSYEIETFFDRVLLTNQSDWRACCNDQILKDSVLEILPYFRTRCESEFPTDKTCFIACVLTKYKEYDTIFGFRENIIYSIVGSKGMHTNGSRLDWKLSVADNAVKVCLNRVCLVPNDNTLICNPDLKTFGDCYWNKMISACPAHLKNSTNCGVNY